MKGIIACLFQLHHANRMRVVAAIHCSVIGYMDDSDIPNVEAKHISFSVIKRKDYVYCIACKMCTVDYNVTTCH